MAEMFDDVTPSGLPGRDLRHAPHYGTLKAGDLRREFVVVDAPAYADPHWLSSEDTARSFVERHGGKIRTRVVGKWEDLP